MIIKGISIAKETIMEMIETQKRKIQMLVKMPE